MPCMQLDETRLPRKHVCNNLSPSEYTRTPVLPRTPQGTEAGPIANHSSQDDGTQADGIPLRQSGDDHFGAAVLNTWHTAAATRNGWTLAAVNPNLCHTRVTTEGDLESTVMLVGCYLLKPYSKLRSFPPGGGQELLLNHIPRGESTGVRHLFFQRRYAAGKLKCHGES